MTTVPGPEVNVIMYRLMLLAGNASCTDLTMESGKNVGLVLPGCWSIRRHQRFDYLSERTRP